MEKEDRKNIGRGLLALGTAGLLFSFISRDRKITKASVDALKRAESLPTSVSAYTAHPIVRRQDPVTYSCVFAGNTPIFIQSGGGPPYHERKGKLTLLWTEQGFSTGYDYVFVDTENTGYVVYRGGRPVDELSLKLRKAFPNHSYFEVRKNKNKVRYCPQHFIASDSVLVLSRRIASKETPYNKTELFAAACPITLGILMLVSTF
ncbi:hypothetical protein [Kurlavirus BKC-1]|nr:hypothetical protein [Kurlavirus BKC-1]